MGDKFPVTRVALTQMESDEPSHDRQRPRDRTRILLVACCLLAIGLAGILVPAVTGGIVDSPAEDIVPGEAIGEEAVDNFGSLADAGLGDIAPGDLQGQNGSAGSLGALNPGDSTQVGGPTGASNGAFSSQSTATHFTVRSSKPAYWRTGAYDEYTGSGWERNGRTASLDSNIVTEGIEGPRVEYEVELNRSAQAVPTVWQPSTVDGLDELQLTAQRAVYAYDGLSARTTYTGVSYKPPQDPSVLQTSGKDYPREIRSGYTQLPSGTPDRLGTFTDDLTADTNSSYETAVAIERWLESEKEYSLEVNRTSDNMADTFAFEMEAGYCEYFATTMVAMLRTQNVPARYVVGYSTGQQVAEDTYKVRGMNAHAWVEVYFEDVGWVKFDPTPGSARLQQEQQSMAESQPDTDYSPTEQGSPGETFTPDEEGTNGDPNNGDVSDGPEGGTNSGYEVALNRTVVPGASVTVTVTKGGDLQSGVTVFFDDEPIGQTGANGTVTGTIPYTDQLNITVGDDSAGSAGRPESATTAALPPPETLPGSGGGRFYSGGTVADTPTLETSSAGTATTPRVSNGDRGGLAAVGTGAANLTVPVETNASIVVTGDKKPGQTVTITATVGGIPIRDGTVLVDGTEANTTDDSGRAAVTLPDSGGNVTITVERGEIRGETTVQVPSLSVAVTPSAPLALPGTEAVVNVTAGGEPVAGAPVFVDGEQVATTDVNGTATVALPFAGSATVRATDGADSAETTVRNLYVNLAGVIGGLMAIVLAFFALAYHFGYTPRDVFVGLYAFPGRALKYGQWALVTVATRWDELLAAAVTRLRRTGAYLRDVVTGNKTVAELRLALSAWLEEKRGTERQPDPTMRADAASDDRHTIRRAWRQFLGYVSLGRPETKTPGEIARHAVDRDDLPARPVEILRDTFREVEYGARSAEKRLDRVQQAVTALEADQREDDEEAEN